MNHGHAYIADDEKEVKNLRTAMVLNTCFAVMELAGGFIKNSVAILSDALHDFGDSLSLGITWYLQKKSRKKGDETYTYGYKRFSLLGAFISSLVLLTGSILVIREAIERLIHSQQPDAGGMIFLAVLGIVFNGIALIRLRKGESLSEKVVSIHFLENVLGWVAVLAGALVMVFADIPVLDPLLSLGVACFIMLNVNRNLKPALKVILQGIPEDSHEEEIKQLILDKPDVAGIHDFHLWSLDGKQIVVTMHLVVTSMMTIKEAEELKDNIRHELKFFQVVHSPIEVEFEPDHSFQ